MIILYTRAHPAICTFPTGIPFPPYPEHQPLSPQSLPGRRTCLLLFLILIARIPITAQQSDNDRLVKMLEGYQKLLNKPEVANNGEDEPRKDWLIITSAIEKNYLRFTISPAESGILKGLYFRAVPGSETTHIIFTRAFINAWERRPSLAYSLLSRQLHEVAFFFRNPDLWQKARHNALEQIFITLDDYTLMSHLILYRLSPFGYDIGEFEQFILESFQKDNLFGAMLFMENITLQLAIVLNSLVSEYEENPDEQEEKTRLEILGLGRSLLDSRLQLPENSRDITIHSHAVGIHSWLELTPYIIARFHNRKRLEAPLKFDKIMELEPLYSELRRQLETQRTRDTPLMNHVHEKTVEGFETF